VSLFSDRRPFIVYSQGLYRYHGQVVVIVGVKYLLSVVYPPLW